MFQLVPAVPPPSPVLAPSPRARPPSKPGHKLTVYELDRGAPVVVGVNPRKVAAIDLPYQLTFQRREAAAIPLIKLHMMREPIEMNHCPGDHMTALVLKG